jgi:alkaline phosphatase D
MKKICTLILLLIATTHFAQVVSGPMIGHTELRTSTIWMHFGNEVKTASLVFYKKGDRKKVTSYFKISDGLFKTATALLYDLEPATTYTYDIFTDNKKEKVATGEVTTQTLWQHRDKVAGVLPTFSFLTGSCAYINQPIYDRPGKPYGNDSSIFETMAKEKANFMLWLGDNWYTREVDYYSEWGLHNRPARERAMPVYKNFLKAMPHYAIWDDHDYGCNDADKSYILKETSREVFKKFWANPSYGENNQGIYTKTTYNDIDIFMLDDRWFRSNDDTPDSINGQVNTNKKMYGTQQMEWLKNALLQSNGNHNITFKIIATGSQVLNPMSPFDCFRHFSAEYKEMMDFIKDNNINGVVFLTGDRHHSEVIKVDRNGTYPLYDITASPLTSGSHKWGKEEKDNPYRVVGVENMQNYSKITFSGERKNRQMNVAFFDPKGIKQTEWSVGIKELTSTKGK